MIEFHDAVAFAFMANAAQGAAFSVLCLVFCNRLLKAALGNSFMCAGVLHMLAHGANNVILICIIIKAFACKLT